MAHQSKFDDISNGFLFDGEVILRYQANDDGSLLTVSLFNASNVYKHLNFPYSDVKPSDALLISCLNEKKLFVNKKVLVSQSPVFRVMFENEFQEKNTCEIRITDHSLDVCQKLVRFMYTGKVVLNLEIAFDLFRAAHKYQMELLQSVCKCFIVSFVKDENVLNILEFAEIYGLRSLKTKCFEQIVNGIRIIKVTEEWKIFISCKSNLFNQLFVHSSYRVKVTRPMGHIMPFIEFIKKGNRHCTFKYPRDEETTEFNTFIFSIWASNRDIQANGSAISYHTC